jgi:hypothetical protein
MLIKCTFVKHIESVVLGEQYISTLHLFHRLLSREYLHDEHGQGLLGLQIFMLTTFTEAYPEKADTKEKKNMNISPD